ncbi:MAG TPA: V-type ATP synthase subunit B [Blastocatellia bacterium]|nr:V-type ATP synthase subunit B [Blastocatellia bacterium]
MKEYRTARTIKGPLLSLDRVRGAGYNELVEVKTAAGDTTAQTVRTGQILEVDHDRAVIQLFAGARGISLEDAVVRFKNEVARIDVSPEMLGRTFDGSGQPVDGGPAVSSGVRLDIQGAPINPVARAHPSEYIHTGISAIDALNTLVRGQKLPIFSGYGLPASEIAVQIATSARIAKVNEKFAVVFAGIGITHRESAFFIREFESSGALEHTVLFLNHADDPIIERLLTPRVALTAAEYLAFQQGCHVLVILTDMTNYAEALREVASAREEVPGRRGFPGYMYTDLATVYERAGRIKGNPGSITQLIILNMPDDDITHPVPDLTGYITEGQIVLSRELHRRGIYPPIDVLPSLSRVMNSGIGADKTREDHRNVADQLYALYAAGRDLRRLVAIIGEAALSAEDRRTLAFADSFETGFIHQGNTSRTLEETLGIAWELMAHVPKSQLKRIKREYIEKYLKAKGESKPDSAT